MFNHSNMWVIRYNSLRQPPVALVVDYCYSRSLHSRSLPLLTTVTVGRFTVAHYRCWLLLQSVASQSLTTAVGQFRCRRSLLVNIRHCLGHCRCCCTMWLLLAVIFYSSWLLLSVTSRHQFISTVIVAYVTGCHSGLCHCLSLLPVVSGDATGHYCSVAVGCCGCLLLSVLPELPKGHWYCWCCSSIHNRWLCYCCYCLFVVTGYYCSLVVI